MTKLEGGTGMFGKRQLRKLLTVGVFLFLFFTVAFGDLMEDITNIVKGISPEIHGMYNALSLNMWNASLIYEDSKLAIGLRLHDESTRSESYKLGFITMKRPVDKSYFNFMAFVGQVHGVALTIGYESYSIPVTGFEKTYYISTNQVLQSEYSKTWLSLPSIPLGETVIGPFALNYEGFSLSKLGNEEPKIEINIKRGYALIDTLPLSFVQIGGIYSFGMFLFADKSLEQGAIVNLGWDFDEGRLVGVLGGRLFIDFQDFRFFFATFGTYIPSSQNVKYGVWFRFLSPISGDLIIQNNVAYFKLRFSE
ncbi:hypothetical protein NA23_09475 [Fervidobacterium islandicum]|uniref:Uncharacterized protein n=1 Tax=Fervidobacterium islandicum TaxID=2423 RepID=A0AAI8GDN0_FERIS|nr:hypothetical protein [Fervidobacterium islandicum]AMW33439.2 hypothetical protein NA23_09475 [Fervidobacterium islandicum]